MSESAAVCARCGCDRVDPSDYGVARMLRDAGVDRIALPERARTLDRATRDKLEGAWDAQRELLRELRDDAVMLAHTLPARDELLALVDDELELCVPVPPGAISTLRWSERPASAKHTIDIDEVRRTHPTARVRLLAALAAARRGDWSRHIEAELWDALDDGDVTGALAAVTLLGWRARRAGVGAHNASRRHDERLERALARASAIPSLSLAAAVGRAARVHDDDADARAVLEQALTTEDIDLKLEAALALSHEATLTAFLADDDPDRADEARRALCALGSAALVPLLIADETRPLPPQTQRRRLLDQLPSTLSAPLRDAVMQCATDEAGGLSTSALAVLTRGRFVDRGADDRVALARFAERNARALGAVRLLELLAWATESDATVAPEDVRPFVAAVATALPDTDAGLIAMADRGVRAFIAHCRPEDLFALDACVLALPTRLDHDPARDLIEAVLDVHARGVGGGGRPASVLRDAFSRWWQLSPRPVSAFSRALAKHRGMRGADDVVELFWRRFCDAPDERRDVVSALGAWLQLLNERREKTEPSQRPDRGDPIAAWEIWAGADPDNMWRLVDALKQQVPAHALARFAAAVFVAANDVVDTKPRTAIVTVFRLAAEIANRFRGSEPSSVLDDAVSALRERLPAFLERFASAQGRPDLDGGETGAQHFTDDIATELRLIDETIARREEAARREQEQKRRDVEREQQRRERERAEQARREQEEKQAQERERIRPRDVESMRASIVGASADRHGTERDAASGGPTLPQPHFERDGLDDEPYLRGPGPCTLIQYAQLIRSLQGGIEPLLLFEVFGLDVGSWPKCSAAWGELMTRDTQLAQRFAALLSADWRT